MFALDAHRIWMVIQAGTAMENIGVSMVPIMKYATNLPRVCFELERWHSKRDTIRSLKLPEEIEHPRI